MVHKLNSTRRFARTHRCCEQRLEQWHSPPRPGRPKRRMEFHEHRRAFRRPRLSSRSSIPIANARESR